MKKMKVLLLASIIFICGILDVYAVCEADEYNTLNRLAMNMRVSYEARTEEKIPDENYTFPDGLTPEEREEYRIITNYFAIYISNITEELYVTVRNDQTGTTETYTYEDAVDGLITIRQDDRTAVNNYTIIVYSSSETNCPDTRLRTMYVTTPLYNRYSTYDICDGAEEFYLCYEYLTIPLPAETEFLELVQQYREGLIDDEGNEITEEEESFWDFIKDHSAVFIIVIVAIVAIGGVVTVIITKKRRRIV